MGRDKDFRMPGTPPLEQEVEEEIEFHLRMRAEELEGKGLAPDEARTQAEAEFGDVEGTRRYCRSEDSRRRGKTRSLGFVLSIRDELTLALRSLGRRPGAVLAPVAILTVAIALNALVLSVVRGVLLTPLPFQDPDRVVVVREMAEDGNLSSAAYLVLDAWKREARLVEAMGSYLENSFPMQTELGPLSAEGAAVTEGFFSLLADPVLRGRAFLPLEHRVGGTPVGMISEGLWKRAFGADPSILGRRIQVEGREVEVVGVVRNEVVFPEGTEIWLPVEQASPGLLEVAGAKIFRTLARLRPGVTRMAVEEEMAAISATVELGSPLAQAVPLEERLLGDVRTPLLLLQGAVLLVLLAAAVNAGGLLLARGVRRRSEVALRASLGAGTSRVAFGLLLEGLILGAVAGAAGILVAVAALNPSLALVPGDLPRVSHIALDPWVMVMAMALACGTGLLTALFSALAGARTSPARLLRESTQGAGSSPWLQRVLEGLVVVQVALAVVLTAGAGLLVRSFISTIQEDPGFRAADVTVVPIALPDFRYPDEGSRMAFARELLDRARMLPGVEAAALGRNSPISGSSMTSPLMVDGFAGITEAVQVAAVTEEYFDVMRIPILEGSGFHGADQADGPPILMVDPGVQDPDGGSVGPGTRAHSFFGDQVFREVRGVVGAVRHNGLRIDPVPVVYEPFFQKGGYPAFDLMARSTAPVGVMAREMRALVQTMDPTLPVDEVTTLSARIRRSVAEPRFYTVVLSFFGVLAVLLALAGCQAGLAHRVAARRRELGIRMALGATVPSVRTMVLRRGLLLTAVGIALGMIAAIPGTRLLESQLYGVSANDPLTYGGLLVLLLLAAALASDLPARRAATTDPANVLREG
mgnify:CR=1 FL=1